MKSLLKSLTYFQPPKWCQVRTIWCLIWFIVRKGLSHFLLNKDKRLQRQVQIEIEKEEKDEMSSQIYQLKIQVEGLKNELLIAEAERFEVVNNKGILAELYDKKIIDDKENPI